MLRVGSVPYLVGRPLDEGLDTEPGIQLVRQVPADLVAGLRARELDVALVSAIELFRMPGYRWIDGLGVAGEGHVGSVQVFLRRPIEDVTRVALDPASRAAATLVRVLFERRPGGPAGLPRAAVRWIEVEPGADPRSVDADAWLRIGDPALREHLAAGSPPVFNPSAEWARRTGLPFVFAAWIVGPGVELAPDVLAAFARARRRGRERIDHLAGEAAQAWQLSEAECRRYLREECLYEPGARMRPSLYRLRDEAAALGLARADLAPEALELAHVA
jgi:chorismate dehydratase